MIVLRAKNAHCALPIALHMMRMKGVARDSRNGRVLQMPEPVTTVYANPCERVAFHSWRDENPFFNFFESLWMLSGRRDIKPLTRYVRRMADFSDDGQTMNAAYGFRWRNARDRDDELCVDQLKIIANNLRKNKGSRQEVLQIWDHAYDLGTMTKDHACNLMASFQVGVDGRLNMVVFCRSNDLIWGCLGANKCHFSFLLEYMSARVGVPCGTYEQVSVNLHAYDATAEELYQYGTKNEEDVEDPYELEPLYTNPIVTQTADNMDLWDADVRAFVTDDGRLPARRTDFNDPWFDQVAWPIVLAHDRYKDGGAGRFDGAMSALERCEAGDWKKACEEWILRREKRASDKEAMFGSKDGEVST